MGSFGGEGGRFLLGFDLRLGIRRRMRREMKMMNVKNEEKDSLKQGRIGIVLRLKSDIIIFYHPQDL